MRLVADSGSTKTDWNVIMPSGEIIVFTSEGYNPFVQTVHYIQNSITEAMVKQEIDCSLVDAVYFYGAGCQGDKVSLMESLLSQIFMQAATVVVEVDLLGAARSLLGDSAGFAAILGTGTNTCLYDGKGISYHVDSLGYLLGDEGSGSAIGRLILVDFLRNQMPEEVRDRFISEYHIVSQEAFLEGVYASGQPNTYFASFTKFVKIDGIYDTYGSALVKRAFRLFFDNLVSAYPDYQKYLFNCVGSVAYHFRDLLEEVAAEYNMRIGRINPFVVEGLVEYHKNK